MLIARTGAKWLVFAGVVRSSPEGGCDATILLYWLGRSIRVPISSSLAASATPISMPQAGRTTRRSVTIITKRRRAGEIQYFYPADS